ncbi:shikimate dehydrogenase [Occultella glacieicola]|uniref:Shikimate dehydrogenase n=1 Tax=Occultella glacieicola TaxID=2518684 RepID=A0ABY2E3P2_9MICO|nr:shikimate dehydrogenase [Occultella glacieicola]TDE92483.1 shikimate dehydrogenase [Occultella glacieicola]
MRHHAAVLGHPVAHSLSPVLHRAAYADLGLTEWEYGLHDVDEGDLSAFVRGLDDSWAGLSLTMPLKQQALALSDHVEPLAKVVGAVNTLLFQPGGLLIGANTDVHGIVEALREATPQPPRADARRGVIIGAGSTAAAALAALGELGIHAPVVLARSVGRAGIVMRAAARMGVTPEYVTLTDDRARAELLGADVVVSTAPHGAADSLVALLDGAALDPDQVLLDVVYEGWPTAVAAAWRSAGGSISPGYLMLLHQAVEQVRLMTGQTGPVAAMRAALMQALAD